MKLNDPFVITISREIGSGGRTVGLKLAEKLGVHYSDKQLIEELEKKLEVSAYGIENIKGQKKGWLADFIQMVAPVPKASAIVGSDSNYIQEFRPEVSVKDVYDAEREILNAIADEGSCVIAGRCGFFVFRNHPNHLSVLVQAPMAFRVARITAKRNISEDEARKIIEKVDKMRENYVKRFTGTSRYEARNYDLVFNTDGKTEEQIANQILMFIE